MLGIRRDARSKSLSPHTAAASYDTRCALHLDESRLLSRALVPDLLVDPGLYCCDRLDVRVCASMMAQDAGHVPRGLARCQLASLCRPCFKAFAARIVQYEFACCSGSSAP